VIEARPLRFGEENMIAEAKICEVQRLLTVGGLSHRKIAKMVGISRATVGAIASGKRPDYEARRHARLEDYPETLGPLARCGGCGGLVYTPCRLCRVRAIKEKEFQAARLARRRVRREALRELLHQLREQALRGDRPRPAPGRLVG
jgi:transposase